MSIWLEFKQKYCVLYILLMYSVSRTHNINGEKSKESKQLSEIIQTVGRKPRGSPDFQELIEILYNCIMAQF
jgi:hypothetical protein